MAQTVAKERRAQQSSRAIRAIANAIEDGARARTRSANMGEWLPGLVNLMDAFPADNAVPEARATFRRQVLASDRVAGMPTVQSQP
jgi:hypothetical protein